jgi:hypothetical protein
VWWFFGASITHNSCQNLVVCLIHVIQVDMLGSNLKAMTKEHPRCSISQRNLFVIYDPLLMDIRKEKAVAIHKPERGEDCFGDLHGSAARKATTSRMRYDMVSGNHEN